MNILVDDCDRDLLEKYTWQINTKGYAQTRTPRPERKSLKLHRLIAARMGLDPRLHVDHANRIKTDNRRANLRAATPAQSCANQGIRKDNTSGVRGISRRANGKYIARVYANRTCRYLGTFDTIDAAVAARDAAAKELHGDYAFTHSPS